MPLLPWWSVVIAVSNSGVPSKTGVRNGSVLVDQRWLQWANKLLPALKAGNLEDKIWNFRFPCSSKHVQGCNRHFCDSTAARFQNSARSAKTRSCLGVVDKAFADPVILKRTTGKYVLDVFGGPGYLAKASNQLGLRGDVLNTKFGPKYDVTKPLIPTRIRQDISAGNCVAGMISPPRQHTSGSSKVIPASAAIANLLHRARMLWIHEQPCDLWLWSVPNIPDSCSTARHNLGLDGLCILVHSTESKLRSWLETWTAEIRSVFLASVLEDVVSLDKTCSSKLRITLRVRFLRVNTPTSSFVLSRLPWFSP